MYINPDNLLEQLRSTLRYKKEKYDSEYYRNPHSPTLQGLRREIARIERLLRALTEDFEKQK